MAGVFFAIGVDIYFSVKKKIVPPEETRHRPELFAPEIELRHLENSLPRVIKEETRVVVFKVIAGEKGVYLFTESDLSKDKIIRVRDTVTSNTNYAANQVFVMSNQNKPKKAKRLNKTADELRKIIENNLQIQIENIIEGKDVIYVFSTDELSDREAKNVQLVVAINSNYLKDKVIVQSRPIRESIEEPTK